MPSAVKQMREAIADGIVEFTPPWLGDVLLEIVARLESLEALEIAEQEEREAFSEGRSTYDRLEARTG